MNGRLHSAVEDVRTALGEGGGTFEEVRAAVFDAGLAWPQFPLGAGGLGLDPVHLPGVAATLAELGVPPTHPKAVIGVGMAAPTLVTHGSPDHLQLLRPIYLQRQLWCQLFSEPGAGSDLANVSTSARRDGDVWVVNGEKIWTSLAHEADWGLLLARTDPEAPKHRGLTFFIVRLDTPGIDIQPLYQITGEAEFNQVTLRDVVIPDSDRLGDPGAGWSVAMTTLSRERGALSGVARSEVAPIDRAITLWHASDRQDPVDRRRLVDLWVRSQLVAETAKKLADDPAVNNGSMSKVLWAELTQDIAEFSVDLLGRRSLEYVPGYPLTRPDLDVHRPDEPQYDYLRSRANSIEGGTSEVLRTLIGEQVLGLEAEPRIDKLVPWRETRRG